MLFALSSLVVPTAWMEWRRGASLVARTIGLFPLAPPRDGYRERLTGATVAVTAPRGGRYRVSWIDDTTGEALTSEPQHVAATNDDLLVLRVPPFTRHAAARVTHE